MESIPLPKCQVVQPRSQSVLEGRIIALLHVGHLNAVVPVLYSIPVAGPIALFESLGLAIRDIPQPNEKSVFCFWSKKIQNKLNKIQILVRGALMLCLCCRPLLISCTQRSGTLHFCKIEA